MVGEFGRLALRAALQGARNQEKCYDDHDGSGENAPSDELLLSGSPGQSQFHASQKDISAATTRSSRD